MEKETYKKPRKKKIEGEGISIDRQTKVVKRISVGQQYKNDTSKPWWISDQNNVQGDVFGVVKSYKNHWSVPYIELIRHVKRYEDRSLGFLSGNDPYSKFSNNDQLSLNVTASCIDTLVSKICKNTPQVQYINNSSDYAESVKAKELQKFIQGHFKFTGAFKIADLAFADCCKMGTGLIHHFVKNDRVQHELIKPYELLFDWTDAINGNPTDIHIVRLKNRYDLMICYPDFKDKLFETGVTNPIYSTSNAFNVDNVVVIESYNRFAKRHTICVENCTLLDEDWTLKNKYGDIDYPISKISFKEADRGFYGIGLAEELKAIHIELQRLVTTAQRSSFLLSVPKIFVPEGSNVSRVSLNNDIGGIIPYSGALAPTGMPLGTVPVGLYNEINLFYQKAYEVSGLSQMSASSQIPAGLQNASGKALETAYQIESDRFQTVGKNFENLIIDMNEKTILMMKMIEERGGDVGDAKYYDADLSKSINWSDVNMEREQFDLQSFPVNMLPSTPEGKFAFVQDMMMSNLIDPIAAKKLLRLPDTDGYLDLQNAEYDFVLKQISDMLQGIDVEPDINQDFDIAFDLVQKSYFLYSTKNVNPIALERIDNYIKSIERIKIVKATQQQAIMQQALQQQQIQMQSTGGQQNNVNSEPSGFASNAIGLTGDTSNGIPQ